MSCEEEKNYDKAWLELSQLLQATGRFPVGNEMVVMIAVVTVKSPAGLLSPVVKGEDVSHSEGPEEKTEHTSGDVVANPSAAQ
jgi:hypothetical protein